MRNPEGEIGWKSERGPLWGLVGLVALIGVIAFAFLVPGPKRESRVTAAERHCGRVTSILSEGQPLPGGCTFEFLQGGQTSSLASFRQGQPMVLNFWASWCTLCIKEMPDFQRVNASLSNRVRFLGLDLLGVQGEGRSAARDLARKTGVQYALGFDDGGALYFHIAPRTLMPTTVFVRADGTLAFRQFGALDAKTLQQLIAKYLGVK